MMIEEGRCYLNTRGGVVGPMYHDTGQWFSSRNSGGKLWDRVTGKRYAVYRGYDWEQEYDTLVAPAEEVSSSMLKDLI